jgi:hypothetical protein
MKKIACFALVVFCLGMPACSKSTPTSPEPPENNLPVIHDFHATPAEIHYKESSYLNWSVSNATKVEIDHGIGVVSFIGSMTVTLTETTTYTLTATNADGQVTKTCTINVKKGAWIEVIEEHKDYIPGVPPRCKVDGVVQNTGDDVGSNLRIKYYAYDSSNTIIDTADGGFDGPENILPGAKVTFFAVFSYLSDWNKVDHLSHDITWVNAEGTINKQVITIR